MSGLFQTLEGEMAILYESGVFKEASLATRGGELYAKARGGFVRLYADGSTSAGSKCRLDTLTLAGDLYRDRLGKLCITKAADRTLIQNEPNFLKITKD